VGKSTVCNLLVRETVSAVSALARGTKTPVICGSDATITQLGVFLPGVRAVRSQGVVGLASFDQPTVVVAPTGFPPCGCLLIDSPDMDSDHAPNRVWAERLLRAADAVILVTTPEKYHDAAVGDFLRRAVALGRSLAAVMNKSDSVEALQDFAQSVWQPMAAEAALIVIPRRPDLGDEADPLRRVIEGWTAHAVEVKATALGGSAHAVRSDLQRLARLVDEEHRWLADLHGGIDACIEDAVRGYRQEVSAERFEELDRVFSRLLQEFRIPVIDDFYDGVRSLGAAVAGHIGRVLGAAGDHGRAVRLERERRRVSGVCRGLAVELSRRVEGVPVALRASAQGWRAAVPQCAERTLVDGFLASTERDVEQWVAEESAAVARTIGSKPTLRRTLVTVKSVLQVGAGVLGGVLTGGLGVSDLALVPVVERLTALLLERGLGYPYFRRCRARLLDAREASLRRFLRSQAEALHQAIPRPEPDVVGRLQEAASRVPGAELLR